MKIGKAIKIARIKKGLSQSELGDLLEVSANYVSMLENDRRDPSWSFLCRLCDTIQIPIPLLLLLGADDNSPLFGEDTIRSTIAQQLLSLLVPTDSTKESRSVGAA